MQFVKYNVDPTKKIQKEQISKHFRTVRATNQNFSCTGFQAANCKLVKITSLKSMYLPAQLTLAQDRKSLTVSL